MKKRKSAAERTETEQLSFEESLTLLETVTAELEAGQLDLAEALARYEHGVRFLRRCRELLDEAQQKIELLVSVDEEGIGATRSFQPDEEGSDDDDSVADD